MGARELWGHSALTASSTYCYKSLPGWGEDSIDTALDARKVTTGVWSPRIHIKVKQAWHPASNPSPQEVETEAGQLEQLNPQAPAVFSEKRNPVSVENQLMAFTHMQIKVQNKTLFQK